MITSAPKVPDPYRWLKTIGHRSGSLGEAQNKVTFAYLDKIPYRRKIKERLTRYTTIRNTLHLRAEATIFSIPRTMVFKPKRLVPAKRPGWSGGSPARSE